MDDMKLKLGFRIGKEKRESEEVAWVRERKDEEAWVGGRFRAT